jgi:hypothetical protein
LLLLFWHVTTNPMLTRTKHQSKCNIILAYSIAQSKWTPWKKTTGHFERRIKTKGIPMTMVPIRRGRSLQRDNGVMVGWCVMMWCVSCCKYIWLRWR